jgi:hypothetical protein
VELTTKLSRRAFYGLVVLVGILLFANFPSLDEVEKSHSNDLITFSVDDRVTALNRHLKNSRRAEARGDSAAQDGSSDTKEYYRTAMENVRRAGYFSKKYSSGGYVDQVLVKTIRRLEGKLRD